MSSVFSGLTWAFTPFAKEKLLELVAAGLQFDLAVALLDEQISQGHFHEAEIYELPEKEELSNSQ